MKLKRHVAALLLLVRSSGGLSPAISNAALADASIGVQGDDLKGRISALEGAGVHGH